MVLPSGRIGPTRTRPGSLRSSSSPLPATPIGRPSGCRACSLRRGPKDVGPKHGRPPGKRSSEVTKGSLVRRRGLSARIMPGMRPRR